MKQRLQHENTISGCLRSSAPCEVGALLSINVALVSDSCQDSELPGRKELSCDANNSAHDSAIKKGGDQNLGGHGRPA